MLIAYPNIINNALRVAMVFTDPANFGEVMEETQDLVPQAQGAAQGQGLAQAHPSTPPSTPPPNEAELECPDPPQQRASETLTHRNLDAFTLNLSGSDQHRIAQDEGYVRERGQNLSHFRSARDEAGFRRFAQLRENQAAEAARAQNRLVLDEDASMGSASGNPENASRGNASGNSEDNSVDNGSENSENQSMGEPESKRQRCESPSKRL